VVPHLKREIYEKAYLPHKAYGPSYYALIIEYLTTIGSLQSSSCHIDLSNDSLVATWCAVRVQAGFKAHL
jgi:hypothetical protein